MAPGCSTLYLPISKDDYLALIESPAAFRDWLDRSFCDSPELFPEGFAQGYTLKDARTSATLGLRLRRIVWTASRRAFTVRPSFVLPSMAGWTDEVEKPLFVRCFGVPFWALARVFGRDPMSRYRLEVGLGRASVGRQGVHHHRRGPGLLPGRQRGRYLR